MTTPLFDLPLQPVPADIPAQACQRCLTVVFAADDRLRVAGWMVYDGRSILGRTLHVRICPACQTEGTS